MVVCGNSTASSRAPAAEPAVLPTLPASTQPHSIIRVEANLLRFPLFALHTKGIRTLDGLRCSGRLQRDGQTMQYTFTATRNTSTLYPGPLARSAHLAFLSILTEAGTPTPLPLAWTWRDLCRRMGVVYGGGLIRQLKQAISSTAGLLIQSESALYSKTEGKRISTREDALHLYERVVFAGNSLPDGSEADQNYLWLSDWYRQNLDAFFTAPLDFALWKHLEGKSPIASRLYEFLLVNAYKDAPALALNYETLTQFLPIKPEKYLSSAQRQLGAGLQLLRANNILRRAEWRESKAGLAQIVFERGDRLTLPASAGNRLPQPADESPEVLAVEELRNQRPPEWYLVNDFYRDLSGNLLHRPTPKELAQAKDLIGQHGVAKAKQVVAQAVKLLKEQWPDAKTFGALVTYIPEALKACDANRRRQHKEKTDMENEQADRIIAARRGDQLSQLKSTWAGLDEAHRAVIRDHVLSKQPQSITKFPTLVERFCLEELARRQSGGFVQAV